MSTQSGIKASDELLSHLHAKKDSTIVITLSDDSTILVRDEEFPEPSGSNIEDVLGSLEEYLSSIFPSPRFAVVFDGVISTRYFVSFIPDVAPIRHKMLYASTKNTLLQQLGNNFSKAHVLGFSELRELKPELFKLAIATGDEDSSLTAKERDIQNLNSLQNLTLSQSTASAYKRELPSMHKKTETSLFFKVEPELEVVLGTNLLRQVVLMNIDTVAETLRLSAQLKDVSPSDLVSSISSATSSSSSPEPAYILYGHEDGKLAFIYACPSGCKVKSRIMYAANKQGLLSHLKQDYLPGQEVVEVIEVGDFDEINATVLDKASGSASGSGSSESSSKKFSKPKGPRRRQGA